MTPSSSHGSMKMGSVDGGRVSAGDERGQTALSTEVIEVVGGECAVLGQRSLSPGAAPGHFQESVRDAPGTVPRDDADTSRGSMKISSLDSGRVSTGDERGQT